MKKGEMIKIYTVKDFDLKNKTLIHEGKIIKITKNFVYVEFGDMIQKYIRRSNCKKNIGYNERLERIKVTLHFYSYIELTEVLK